MKQTTGVIALTRVYSGRGETLKTVLQPIALRAADVMEVQPIESPAEPEAHALVITGGKAYWVKETVDEVTALINARQDLAQQQLAVLRDIAAILADWQAQNFGRGI